MPRDAFSVNAARCVVGPHHELGHDAEVGHFDLWPSVIDRLAEVWCKDPRILGRRLRLSYTALPRGRITVLSPPDWLIVQRTDANFRIVSSDVLWSASFAAAQQLARTSTSKSRSWASLAA